MKTSLGGSGAGLAGADITNGPYNKEGSRPDGVVWFNKRIESLKGNNRTINIIKCTYTYYGN